jgi:hypothetical protein
LNNDQRFWNVNNIRLFIYIICLYTVIGFIDNNYVLNGVQSEASNESLDTILSHSTRFHFWSSINETIYDILILSILIYIKLLLTLGCILLGALLNEVNVNLKNIFKTLIIGECVFIISQVLFSINLFLNKGNLIFERIPNYFPLSMLSYLGVENVVPWLHYPLQTLNLFEVVYILYISWLLSKQWKPDFVESMNIVIPSYGLGLLIWIVLVVFLTLQIS